MATHHVVGDNMSPFMKRVLIPFWVIRIAIMVFEIVIYGLFIGVIARWKSDDDDYYYEDDTSINVAIGVAVVILLIILLCLVLDIVCIVKRARRTLSPRFFLIVNVIQTFIWTVLFILSLIGSSRSALGIILAVVIYLSFIGVLIYASVIYHRYRKGTLRGTYVPAVNPAGTGEQQGFVQATGYPGHNVYPSNSYPDPNYQNNYQNPSYASYPNPAYGEQKATYYDPVGGQPGVQAHELQNRMA